MPLLLDFQLFKTGSVEFASGYELHTKDAGALTNKATYPTYADAVAGTNANTNPVILDSQGVAQVWVKGPTKIIYTIPGGDIGSPIWTIDNIDVGNSDIVDSAGNELIAFVEDTNAINEITISNAAISTSPSISATGNDTNINLILAAKGTGLIELSSDLDMSENTITNSTTNGSITIETNGTGNINLSANNLNVTSPANFSGAVSVPTTSSGFNLLPPGLVMWKASTNVPDGWLECDGSAISRTTYSALFADIGTSFGSGDGSTTFNLPNQARVTLVGRGGSSTATLANTVAATGGAETVSLTTSNMPAGVPYTATVQNKLLANSALGVDFNVAGGSAGFSAGGATAHNNIQPSLVMMMIIKI